MIIEFPANLSGGGGGPGTKRRRTGCIGCRLRHKKCPEEKPQCVNCLRNGLLCTWPEPGNKRHAELLTRTNLTHRKTNHCHSRKRSSESASDIKPTAQELEGHIKSTETEVTKHGDTHNSSPIPILSSDNVSNSWIPRALDPLDLVQRLRRPYSKKLLHHYVHRTTKVIALYQTSGKKNPFVAELLPMAVSSNLILDGLLACSGIHLANLVGGTVDETTWVHYGQAIQAQKFGLTTLTQGNSEVLVSLLVTAMLLCIFEVSTLKPYNDTEHQHEFVKRVWDHFFFLTYIYLY